MPRKPQIDAVRRTQQTNLTLLVKLGSIMVHAEELSSPTGHHFDKVALDSLLTDPEIVAWREKMKVFLPVKR